MTEKDRLYKSRTLSLREMTREARRQKKKGQALKILTYERPKNRSECINGPRPCLYIACRYHLYLDVHPETGSIKINFPGKEPWELKNSCALDIAERGGVTLEEAGDILNLTRERVRQVETTGLGKIRESDIKDF